VPEWINSNTDNLEGSPKGAFDTHGSDTGTTVIDCCLFLVELFCDKFVVLFFFLNHDGGGTQGLVYAVQTLYH
jgi:hypothetical protein